MPLHFRPYACSLPYEKALCSARPAQGRVFELNLDVVANAQFFDKSTILFNILVFNVL